jgi:hypothetical protein
VIEVYLQPDEAAGDHLLCINQLIPWYARARLHTLSLLLDGRPAAWTEHSARSRLLPPRDRQRPATLELCLANVTALASLLHLTVVFDKAFLTVTEHPPDAHRCAPKFTSNLPSIATYSFFQLQTFSGIKAFRLF